MENSPSIGREIAEKIYISLLEIAWLGNYLFLCGEDKSELFWLYIYDIVQKKFFEPNSSLTSNEIKKNPVPAKPALKLNARVNQSHSFYMINWFFCIMIRAVRK